MSLGDGSGREGGVRGVRESLERVGLADHPFGQTGTEVDRSLAADPSQGSSTDTRQLAQGLEDRPVLGPLRQLNT
jgi:hypothetical protein